MKVNDLVFEATSTLDIFQYNSFVDAPHFYMHVYYLFSIIFAVNAINSFLLVTMRI